MATRTRDQSVVRQARKRDNMTCQKCGRREGEIHAHHVVPLDEGGADTLDNVIMLCQPCHGEWESMYKAFTFNEWMALPPAVVVLKMLTMADKWPENVSAAEFRRLLLGSSEMLRAVRSVELREGEPGYDDDDD